MLNDVSALRFDPQAAAAAAETGLPVVLMHAQGDPRTMQLSPSSMMWRWMFMTIWKSACMLPPQRALRSCALTPASGSARRFSTISKLSQLTLFHGLVCRFWWDYRARLSSAR